MVLRVFVVFLFLWMLSPCSLQASEQWHFIDTFEHVELYRAAETRPGYLPFKAVASLNASYGEIVMALVDVERKHLWAPKLKTAIVHRTVGSNSFEYSEYYTTPWPFHDREFLLSGQVTYLPDRIRFSAENSENIMLADEDHVLVDLEVLIFDIIPVSDEQCRVEFIFSGHMGGWIPEFVETIIQRKWPVRFIQALEKRIGEEHHLGSPRYDELVKRNFFAD